MGLVIFHYHQIERIMKKEFFPYDKPNLKKVAIVLRYILKRME